MTILKYIETLNQSFKSGNYTELTLRSDLQRLLEFLVTDIRAVNEPKRQSCGAPDYIITKGEITVGFIETKNIGDKDLEGKKKNGNQEQFERYRNALSNLIITDYIEFHFYKDSILSTKIQIGKISNGSIVPVPENFDEFTKLFRNFCETITQTIKSPTRLAEMMAGKARLMADIIEKSLNEDDEQGVLSNLKKQMLSFKQMLISDIDNKSFSDLYSQTIAYGMFAARYHDPTLETFSREESIKLIPKSNPFLRKLFKDIADEDLDTRLVWIIDELVRVFLSSDVALIMKNFGKSTKQEDPVIHFYETFLASYNPSLRKSRGVWYTPQPVVNFLVRALDDILKSEFDLKDGLSDSSKKKIKVNYQGKQINKEIHQVQILDPATGTGTFLSEIIKHVYKKYELMQGVWSKYVENDLIPRLNGFELLMASYAMSHLKLDMLLTETGYIPSRDQRIRVFLTNSLEEPHPDSGTLWGNLLSEESDQANEIKRDTPIMCIIGNPPYSGESSNKSQWIMNLMEDYKKEPGGIQKLNERNPKWINDDYVKFIRYGQYHVEKNGKGIIAFINPHGFLDNPTFRGMRWNLLKTFDKIYTIDLHGNSKKNEISPDGSPDINVFDIMQGVSINIFIKTGEKNPNQLGKVFHFDLFGRRDYKYEFLTENSIDSISFNEIEVTPPNYFFVNKNFEYQQEYEKGFKLDDFFILNNVGVVTANDSVLVNNSKDILIKNIENYYQVKPNHELIQEISYRLFDLKYVYYDTKLIERPREKVMNHLINGNNIALTLCKQFKSGNNYCHVFITDRIIESSYVSNKTSEITSIFPLYLSEESDKQQSFALSLKNRHNLNTDIVKQFEDVLCIKFSESSDKSNITFTPEDILHYIYAILHSPKYREKYKEFLKIDFPRIPLPHEKDSFWRSVKIGNELKNLHLLKSKLLDNSKIKYPIHGSNVVEKIRYEDGKIYINDSQYFESISEIAWDFQIGGYQPLQKWIKDRRNTELGLDEIKHYVKIINSITETDKLMKEIDNLNLVT